MVEGLEVSDRKGVIPAKLVEKLDLVYYLGNSNGEPTSFLGVDLQHSVENIGGVVTEIRKILMPDSSAVKVTVSEGGEIYEGKEKFEVVKKMKERDKTLEELFIFGATLEHALDDFAVTPIFCLGKRPEGRWTGGGYISYQGLYPVGYPGGLMRVDQNEWSGRISVPPNGKKGFVYFGNACMPSTAEAVLFENLIPFDFGKRLVLVRSPNGSMSFDALYRLELPEGDGKIEYALVYDKIKPLREGRTWAVNTPEGLNWEHNSYLNIFTRRK